jgi:SpoVK/Ycf46/Vps4 family AAA+-type ATPase
VARIDTLYVLVDQELGVPFISVSAPSIVSGMSGESEKTLRETFEEAKVRSYIYLECSST